MSKDNDIGRLAQVKNVSQFRYAALEILRQNPERIKEVIEVANKLQFGGLQGELRDIRLALPKIEARQRSDYLRVAFRKCNRITKYHHFLTHLQNLAAHARSRR